MTTGAPVTPSKPKTSGLAIASLILGIIGPCSLGLLSIVGLILGIVGLKKIKASGGTVGGRGLAIAGIIVSIITLIIGVAAAVAIVGGAWFIAGEAKGQATQLVCLANVQQLCAVAQQYAKANEDALPPADTWPEAFKSGNYLFSHQVPACLDRVTAGRTYAMNAKVGGMRRSQIRRLSETVLFFECSPGAPPSGGRADLPSEPPHIGGWTIGFCDGHVEVVAPSRLDQLVWDPKAE